MSSFKSYVENGIHSQNSSTDAARLGRNLISRAGTNIYRSAYASSGLNYGTRARSNGNSYCTTKTGNYTGNRIIDAYWGRDRGARKIQTLNSTKISTKAGKYSDTVFTGVSYPSTKQYRYSSSPQVIDKSSTISSIPIKIHSSLSSTKYSVYSNTPGNSISRTDDNHTNVSTQKNLENTPNTESCGNFFEHENLDLGSTVSYIQSNADRKSIDFCHESESDSTLEGKSFDVDKVSIENKNITFPASTVQTYTNIESTESLPKSFEGQRNKYTIDKNSECTISFDDKLPNSTSNSNILTSQSNKLTRSLSPKIFKYNGQECTKTSFSNLKEASNSLLSNQELTFTQSELSKAQARSQNVAENADVQSEKSSGSFLHLQRSFDGSSNNINGKPNDTSRHKSAVPVSSGCNNSARSSRKLVPSSSSLSTTELTAIKIKSAATTTTVAATASSSSSSSSRDSGSTSKSSSSSNSTSSSSSSSSCSGSSSGSNISSDSNNSISSQSASDVSKSSSGKREIIPVVSPVSLTQTVSSDVRNKKPPIPKFEMIRKKMSSPINKYVNKDFRKSALNMENGDASRSQILSQKKYRQKSTKNPSISCQDSQANSSSSTTTPSNRQFPAGSSSQSFSSDASGSNSSNENKEENQSNYANKSRISKNKNESSALITDAKQLVSSVDERSINVNSLARTRSTSKSTSDAFHNTDEKSVPLMHNPSATAILSNSKSCCTASFVEGNSRVSLPQSSSNGPQCTNLDDSSPANKNSGQARHQFSDEVPWWLDPNSDNVPEGVERHFSVASDDTIQDTTISSVLPDDGKFKFQIWHQGSEERCWWVDDNDNDCTLNNNLLSLKNETASPVRGSSPQSLDIQSGNSGQSKPSSPEVYMTKNRALRHEKSGERAWWLSDDPNNIPEGVDVIPVSPNVSQSSQYKEKRSDEQESQQTQNRFNRLRHIDSGERPWWLDSSSNVPEGVERISLSDSHSDDSSESLHQVDCTGIQRNQQCQSTDEVDRGCRCSATFPLSNETFTDRTSLEGREISANIFSGGRSSPYDNIKGNFSSNDQSSELFEYQKPNNTSLYIGNQTNIDDLLEGLVEFDQACRDMEKQNEHFAEYISDRNETICEVGLHGNRTDTYKNLYIHRNAEIQLAQNYMPQHP